MTREFISVCGLLSVILIASQVRVDVFVPDDLDPGDQYHLVFVTVGTINGFIADISVYKNFAQTQAEFNLSVTGTDTGVM